MKLKRLFELSNKYPNVEISFYMESRMVSNFFYHWEGDGDKFNRRFDLLEEHVKSGEKTIIYIPTDVNSLFINHMWEFFSDQARDSKEILESKLDVTWHRETYMPVDLKEYILHLVVETENIDQIKNYNPSVVFIQPNFSYLGREFYLVHLKEDCYKLLKLMKMLNIQVYNISTSLRNYSSQHKILVMLSEKFPYFGDMTIP